MKLKALIATLFVAGFASSFAFAGNTRGAADTTTGTTTHETTTHETTTQETTTHETTTHETTTGTTSRTPAAPTCQKLELKGSNGTGSVSFTVDKASGKKGGALAGTPVTLTVPAGAVVKATACRDAAGALTLRGLELSVKHGESQGKGGKG